MRKLNRRGFIGESAGNLIKISSGLYILGQGLVFAGCGSSSTYKNSEQKIGGSVLDETVFDDFPIAEITPASELFIQKVDITPMISANDWNLAVTGEVDNELSFTYEDLLGRNQTTLYNTLTCVGNAVGGNAAGHCEWGGVKLKTLLEEAGVRSGAVDVVFIAEGDSYSDSITLSKAMEEDVILALTINGEPLTSAHGFPLRAIVPDIYGMKNVKWISRIEVVAYDYKGYWQARRWSDSAVIKTYSAIRWDSLTLSHPVTFIGIAYAGERGVERVEVSLDEGATWEEALIKEPLSKYSWVLWAYRIDSSLLGDFPFTVRTVETGGVIQGADGLTDDPFPSGANAYHQEWFTIR